METTETVTETTTETPEPDQTIVVAPIIAPTASQETPDLAVMVGELRSTVEAMQTEISAIREEASTARVVADSALTAATTVEEVSTEVVESVDVPAIASESTEVEAPRKRSTLAKILLG